MGRVQGKVAIITGGASGLGEADAEALVAQGAQVIIADIDETLGSRVAERIGAHFLRHDVTSEDDWRNTIDVAFARFGRLDVLVNNAAAAKVSELGDTTLDDYRMINRVNSEGVFLGCRFAVEAMAKAGSGSIINMSSMAAIRGFPQVIAYAASKGAVRSLSLTVAAHCLRVGLPGIRCNTILPGATLTPMQQRAHEGMREGATAAEVADPRNRVGQPSDIANLVVYLSSDESRHITGQEFVVDGGYSIW